MNIYFFYIILIMFIDFKIKPTVFDKYFKYRNTHLTLLYPTCTSTHLYIPNGQ